MCNHCLVEGHQQQRIVSQNQGLQSMIQEYLKRKRMNVEIFNILDTRGMSCQCFESRDTFILELCLPFTFFVFNSIAEYNKLAHTGSKSSPPLLQMNM